MTKQYTISFDEWILDQESGELERDGKRQRLQELPLQILVELLKQPGELVTREKLIAKLWPQGVVDFDSNLNTAVSKLRSALGDNATPRYIETIPRKGYRFIGKVALAAPTPPDEARASNKRTVVWTFAAIVLVAVGAAVAAYVNKPASPVHVRLAVMPFENLSPDPDNAFFADGMHEEILGALANRATQMDVISRTTMMTYRARPKAVADIAKNLGVTHLLEGSVRRDGKTVRVTLQLIDARNDKHLWSHSFDRELVNAMTLQSQVATEVAAQLAVQLSPSAIDLPPSQNSEAYDYYLRAKLAIQSINQRTSLEEALRIEAWLTRSIELDPTFAAAYASRANVRISKFVQNLDVSDANQQAARADITVAHKLAGDAPFVMRIQSRLAAAIDNDYARSYDLTNKASMTSSKDPQIILWIAFGLSRQGFPEKGLPLYAQAAAIDPGNRVLFFAWELDLWSLRRPAEALRVVRSYNEHGPGKMNFGDLEFSFTGQTARLRRDITELSDSMGAESRLLATFDLLRFERREKDLPGLLKEWSATTNATNVRLSGFREYGIPGVGHKPLAELQGWASLLGGNAPDAARDGRVVMKFAVNEPITKHNAWHLRMLAAEAALFSGDRTKAASEARAALAMTDPDKQVIHRYSALLGARVLAWAGAGDESVELLEKLSNQFPMLGPAEITRDPLFSIPLSKNARYQVLVKTLEAEIATNQSLFAAGPIKKMP